MTTAEKAEVARIELRRYGAPDYSGQDLRWKDFSGRDLKYARFVDADLTGADLYGANLSGAILTRANLLEANLGDWERGPDGYARRKR